MRPERRRSFWRMNLRSIVAVSAVTLSVVACGWRGTVALVEEASIGVEAGTDWPGRHKAPQLIMAPAAVLLTPQKAEAFVQEQILETGFHGVHIPVLGEPINDGVIRMLELGEEHDFWIHFWLYGDIQHGQAPEDPNDEDARRHQENVLGQIKRFPHWSMGLGFDLHEWASFDAVGSWIHFMRVGLGDDHIYGGRSLDRLLPGHYAGWEQQVKDKNEFRSMLREAKRKSKGRRVMSEDRFRVRPVLEDKDWAEGEVPDGIRMAIEEGVACIWGIGEGVADKGSEPWPNKSAIRQALAGGQMVVNPWISDDAVIGVVTDLSGTIMVKRYRLVLPGEQ